MKITHRLALLAAGTMVVTGGLAVAEAASGPAAHAACYTKLTELGAWNSSCKPKMRHWVVTRPNNTTYYGPTVTPGNWSNQKVCYANVASRGVTIRS